MAILWAQRPRTAHPSDHVVSTAGKLGDVLVQARLATHWTARSSYKEMGSHMALLRESASLQTKWGLKSPRTLGVGWGSAHNLALCLFAFLRMMPTFSCVANTQFPPCFEIVQESSKCSASVHRIAIYLSTANLPGGRGGNTNLFIWFPFGLRKRANKAITLQKLSLPGQASFYSQP